MRVRVRSLFSVEFGVRLSIMVRVSVRFKLRVRVQSKRESC